MTEKRFYLNEGEVGILKILDLKEDNEKIYHTASKSDMKMIVELLNELNEENENLKNALWEAEEEYLYEAYRDNPIRLQDKIIGLKEDWDKEYWNDG